MGLSVWQIERSKGRTPLWAYRVEEKGRAIFESRSVSVRFVRDSGAQWIGSLIDQIQASGMTLPTGEPTSGLALEWRGDLTDDCGACMQEYSAHAEWMRGPRNGGKWYCSAFSPRGRLFHTMDAYPDIQPRNGRAARWLCETVMSAASAGFLTEYLE